MSLRVISVSLRVTHGDGGVAGRLAAEADAHAQRSFDAPKVHTAVGG